MGKLTKTGKIWITILCIVIVALSGYLAYEKGYFHSLFGEKKIDAKKSNYPNYVERFEFNDMKFVQNTHVVVPTPEEVAKGNFLKGALSFKHNGTSPKILFVDMPSRVVLTEADTGFWYRQEILEDNLTVRHYFKVIPNKEHNIYYKILNINEFIDHSGSVNFVLRTQDNDVYNVETKFLSSVEEYEDIRLGDYWENAEDRYSSYIVNGEMKFTFKNKDNVDYNSNNPIIYINNYLGVFDNGDQLSFDFLPHGLNVGDTYRVLTTKDTIFFFF